MNKDVNIVLVDGMPSTGKTTFTSNLVNQDKTSCWLSLDRMSFDYAKSHNIKINNTKPNIAEFYREHFDSDKLINELLRYLEFGRVGLVDMRNACCNEVVPVTFWDKAWPATVCVVGPNHPSGDLKNLSDVFTSFIVIEGFFIACLRKLGYDLESILKDNGYKNIFSISLKCSRQNFSAVIGERAYDINSNNYSEVFKRLHSDIKSKCIKSVFNNKHEWPSHRSLEAMKIKSDKKYSFSGMDAIISKFTQRAAAHSAEEFQATGRLLPDPSILDVGCNKGFFCYKFSEQTNGSILGIDINPESIKDANRLNFSIFKNPNIKFENVDFFDFKCGKKYDIVFCASTFHYFRNNQSEFINKVWSDVIAPQGALVLEVEIYPNNDKPERESRSRVVDKTPCLFPNKKYLENMITGKFSIEAINKSRFQKGSYYDRYFFDMRKI